MKGPARCPRCGTEVRPPGLWSSDWTCPQHGSVLPWQPVPQPTAEVVRRVSAAARVPVWLPWPLPAGWVLTGLSHCGDDRTGPLATAVACSGPHPFGPGAGDWLLVAEEPGTGFGAYFAGIDGPDPGPAVVTGPAPVKVHAAGHVTPLWPVPAAPDRAVYVGEAGGRWLWVVLWPDTAGHLLLDGPSLVDVRELGAETDLLPLGALSPRLA